MSSVSFCLTFGFLCLFANVIPKLLIETVPIELSADTRNTDCKHEKVGKKQIIGCKEHEAWLSSGACCSNRRPQPLPSPAHLVTFGLLGSLQQGQLAWLDSLSVDHQNVTYSGSKKNTCCVSVKRLNVLQGKFSTGNQCVIFKQGDFIGVIFIGIIHNDSQLNLF